MWVCSCSSCCSCSCRCSCSCSCLSIYLSSCKLENEAILRDILSFWTWQHQKRSNSGRHPQFLNLTTSKTKLFCETSSIFEVDNIKSEAILRDVLQKWSWAQSWRPRTNAFCDFFFFMCVKRCACHEKIDARLHLSRKIIWANLKIWCSKMQPLSTNQRPDLLTSLMNMSLVLTSKSDPKMVCFVCFYFDMCFRTTIACTFSTSQLPKVVRAWAALYILTWKCASRHNNVQFFISHLPSWLRTRRFSEPTFRPSGATNHWKNTVFRDFPTFSHTYIFFLLTLFLLWSSLFSSLLWLFPPLLFHLSMLSEVWLLNFLRLHYRWRLSCWPIQLGPRLGGHRIAFSHGQMANLAILACQRHAQRSAHVGST